jgi:hypothetical protein
MNKPEAFRIAVQNAAVSHWLICIAPMQRTDVPCVVTLMLGRQDE